MTKTDDYWAKIGLHENVFPYIILIRKTCVVVYKYCVYSIMYFRGDYMKIYNKDTVYFIAYAKLPTEISAAHVHKVVGVGMIINKETGIVEDASCTLVTPEAISFIKQIIVGHNLHKEGIEPIIEGIKQRFHGASQKSLWVASKGTYEKYVMWKKEK